MEIQAYRGGAKAAAMAQTWLSAIQGFTRLGMNGQQSDNEQRQINTINTAYILIVLPAWLLLASSYWFAAQWPAALVMTAGMVTLSTLVILNSQGRLNLPNYGQFSLPLVFLIPVAVALCLGDHLRSGLVTNWSLATPLLAIVLDQPRTARRWFALLVAINMGMLLLPGDFIQPAMEPAIWIKFWQIFNRIGMLIAIYLCLNYLHQQQRQAIQQLDTFAATVSHELRNPLTSVSLGLAHGLRQQERLSDSQRLALQTASQEANRCQVILGDLLALSRSDPHSQSQSLTSLDPYPLVVAIGESLRPSLGVNLSITSTAPVSQRWVLADPMRLRQVLDNLIENSSKYSDRQQPVELTISAAKGDSQLVIQVADRGAMLSTQDCLAMFKPFTRLANAIDKPGSGLGLTVVRRLVNGMGGTILATPRQGGGLIVTLALVRSGPPARTPSRAAHLKGLSRSDGGGDSSSRG
jgi:signal transduction histidine kinase